MLLVNLARRIAEICEQINDATMKCILAMYDESQHPKMRSELEQSNII